MKKQIILSLLATLVSVLGISAQENTYSMVIKLNNGTVLTIGPNEVDSISFNDGQVTFSGQNLSQLVEKVDSIEEANGYYTHDNIMNIMDHIYSETPKKEEVNTVLARLISPNLNIQGDYWYINGEKTNLYSDSYSPYVGDNGNWWLGRYSWSGYYNGQDTGIKARSIEEVEENMYQRFYTKEEVLHLLSNYFTREGVDYLINVLDMKIGELQKEIYELKQ